MKATRKPEFAAKLKVEQSLLDGYSIDSVADDIEGHDVSDGGPLDRPAAAVPRVVHSGAGLLGLLYRSSRSSYLTCLPLLSPADGTPDDGSCCCPSLPVLCEFREAFRQSASTLCAASSCSPTATSRCSSSLPYREPTSFASRTPPSRRMLL